MHAHLLTSSRVDVADVDVFIGSCSDPDYIDQLNPCGTIPSDPAFDVIPDHNPGNANNVRQPAFAECTLSDNPYGRYVYIRRDTANGVTGTLAVCEVMVYGREGMFGGN